LRCQHPPCNDVEFEPFLFIFSQGLHIQFLFTQCGLLKIFELLLGEKSKKNFTNY
jgi:hypothetical protein